MKKRVIPMSNYPPELLALLAVKKSLFDFQFGKE